MSGRVRVKPSKSQSLVGMIGGAVFVIIGFSLMPMMGVFGIIWTLFAVAICGIHAYNYFSNRGLASWEIDIDSASNVQGYFEEKLDLVGIINCSGCPTLVGPDKLLGRIRALTEFRIDAIHFTYCMDVLCPFKAKYKSLLEEHFPNIEIIVGTHEAHVTNEQFREDVKGLLCQPKRSMVDVIKGR